MGIDNLKKEYELLRTVKIRNGLVDESFPKFEDLNLYFGNRDLYKIDKMGPNNAGLFYTINCYEMGTITIHIKDKKENGDVVSTSLIVSAGGNKLRQNTDFIDGNNYSLDIAYYPSGCVVQGCKYDKIYSPTALVRLPKVKADSIKEFYAVCNKIMKMGVRGFIAYDGDTFALTEKDLKKYGIEKKKKANASAAELHTINAKLAEYREKAKDRELSQKKAMEERIRKSKEVEEWQNNPENPSNKRIEELKTIKRQYKALNDLLEVAPELITDEQMKLLREHMIFLKGKAMQDDAEKKKQETNDPYKYHGDHYGMEQGIREWYQNEYGEGNKHNR